MRQLNGCAPELFDNLVQNAVMASSFHNSEVLSILGKDVKLNFRKGV